MESKRLSAFATLAVASVLTSAAPASVPEPVGERIDVLAGTPTTFPTGQPFHVRHGWGVGVTPPPDLAGRFWFELDVDGTSRPPDAVERSTDPAPETGLDAPVLNRWWLFNFAAGLTGTHTFTGRWLAPCRIAVADLGHAGPCANPAERVVVHERSLAVNFRIPEVEPLDP
jgi:hypothetical protein